MKSSSTTAQRPAHRPSRRDAILSAGAAEFLEHGFAAASVAAIARRAGMTPAAIYYHFATKEDVLVELVDRTGESLLALCAAREDADDPGGALDRLIDEFADWLEGHSDEALLYYLASDGLTPGVAALQRDQRRDQVRALLSGRLKPCAASLTPTEARVAALGVLALFHELTQALLDMGPGASRARRAALRSDAKDLARRLLPAG